MSRKSTPQFDLRSELISGDPSRQSRALLAVLGLLSAGREVGSHISLICQAILGNASVGTDVRCTAYDVIAAAMPSDTDCARISAAIIADLQKGSTAEVRVKALSSIALLPSHRLLAMLNDDIVRERLAAVLRSPSPPVRAAAIEAINGLVFSDAIAAAAYYVHPTDDDTTTRAASIENAVTTPRSSSAALGLALGLSALLTDAVAAAGEGLIDDDSGVVVSSCRAMNALLQAAFSTTNTNNGMSGGALASTGNGGKASVVRSEMGLAAISAVDEAFPVAIARFRSLPAMVQCETPAVLCSYLKAIQQRDGTRPLDTLPGDEGGAGRHAFEETASLLSELVRGGDPPSVLAAAQGLFELGEMDTASATVQAVLPSAIAAVIGASSATSASSHQRSVAQHAVLNLLLRHLDVLPSVQRAALFSRLPPIIAAMPAALDRVKSFYLLWSAVAAFDWNTNALTRNNTTKNAVVVSTPQLQLLLLDPHLKEAISGVSSSTNSSSSSSGGVNSSSNTSNTAGPPPHERYNDPIFREEVVGTLLYVLLTHPRPAAVTGDGVAAASSAVAQASALQAASAAVDWLVTAKLALQGTKACLGWDRMAGVQTTGSTAAADLWLQLLLRCIQLSKMLKVKLGPTAARHAQAMATAQAAAAQQQQQQHQQEEGEPAPAVPSVDPGTAALAALVRRASELEGEMQGLLLQIAANWRALHPVVRPRAVWLCACHLRLRSVVDGAWTSLADAVHGLLADARAARDVGGVSGYMASVAEGSLKIKDNGGGTTSSGGGRRHEAGVAAGAGEAEEVALLSLERLAGLVSSNHQGRLEGHLSAVATLLDKLVGVCLNSGLLSLSPSAGERVARVGEVLKPVASAGKKTSSGTNSNATIIATSIMATTISLRKSTGGSGGGSGGDGVSSSDAPIVVELVQIESTSGSAVASYPSTLPTAAALFGAPESTRYRKFLEQLQAAALEKSIAAGGGAAAVAAAAHARGNSNSSTTSSASPSGGLPTLHQLTQALEGGSSNSSGGNGNSGDAIEVTGAAAPITLSLSHTVDPGAGSIRLRCVAINKTKQALSGVAVTLLLGGPVAGGIRRPLTFRLNTLPAGETSSWEVPLRVDGFGWPVIQPAVTLPAQTPAGFQPTLRCRPYAVSPLQLLAPVARAMSPAEFYQRWQAMPHKACVAASPVEAGPLGLLKVLAAIEGAGLNCLMKAVVPVAGGVHAAFYGSAWSGESIAVVVTSSSENNNNNNSDGSGDKKQSGSSGSGGSSSKTVLHLHFGSEASEVVAHIRGHESDLLAQLTGGAAVPAVGTSDLGGSGVDQIAATSGGASREEDRPTSVSTFSFLRSVALQMDVGRIGGGEDENEDEAEKVAAIQKETDTLQNAALTQWKKVYALRV
jgi:hypothetical protein